MSKNPPIGSCPCPITGCKETAAVYKFATRAVRDTGRRFGGKLYLVCQSHGTLGLAGNRAMQEFILEHANIPKDALELEQPAAAPPVPVPAVPATARAPARAPDPAPPAAKPKRSWGSVLDE